MCFNYHGIKREDVIVITKIKDEDKHDVEKAVRDSLAKLQLDYIDIYLMHWMIPKHVYTQDEKQDLIIYPTPLHKVYAELERLVDLGLIRAIGVSNCQIPMLLDILSFCRYKPVLNQIELHPYFTQKELIAFHRKLEIQVQGYAPLGS